MRRYKFDKFKLSANVIRDGQSVQLDGTFGPFSFDALMLECNTCHSYIPDSITVWNTKGFWGKQARIKATMTIENRLANAQVPKLRQNEQTQINL